MSTTARLFIDDLPAGGEGARRIGVDCKWSTTTAYLIPGELELSEAELVTVALMRHEEACGRCNTARLWRRADPALRAATVAALEQLGALAMRERRN